MRSELGETAASLCNNQQILYLLNTTSATQRIMNDLSLHPSITSAYTQPDFLHVTMNPKIENNAHDGSQFVTSFQNGSICINTFRIERIIYK